MGFQALHPAQGMRGRQQVVSVVALTAAMFLCSDPEPRAPRTVGPHPGEAWVQCLPARHPIMVMRTFGPRLSRDEAGTCMDDSTDPWEVPLESGAVQGKLQPLPALGSFTHPSSLPGQCLSPLAKWGCRDAAHTCQVHTGPAGGLKTSWKATHDSVSSTSIDAHLREMIPTSHLTVILQLIVI